MYRRHCALLKGSEPAILLENSLKTRSVARQNTRWLEWLIWDWSRSETSQYPNCDNVLLSRYVKEEASDLTQVIHSLDRGITKWHDSIGGTDHRLWDICDSPLDFRLQNPPQDDGPAVSYLPIFLCKASSRSCRNTDRQTALYQIRRCPSSPMRWAMRQDSG